MELSNLTWLSGEAFDENALGAALLRRQGSSSSQSALLHDFDMVILVLHEELEEGYQIQDSLTGEIRSQILHVDLDSLQRSVITGDNNERISCILEGDIIWDPQGVLEQIRQEIIRFSKPLRDRILFVEFARLLHMYVKSKRYIQAGCIMDAYNCILVALYHWARLEVTEQGRYPEPAVWEQVKELNSSVYKMYEELTVSGETLEQRIQLAQLACEFSMMSQMGQSCSFLLNWMKERGETWSVQELLKHSDFQPVALELPLVLRKLASRALVQEVASWKEGGGCAVQYAVC
ncbi:nucleotidyltransferase-like protein [Paenibacillus spiritus]|nr:nucleotidyltransferase-like protein [Paenibacillus spiritus]